MNEVIENANEWKQRATTETVNNIDELIASLTALKMQVLSESEPPQDTKVDIMTSQSVGVRDSLKKLKNWHSMVRMLEYNKREMEKKAG